MFARRYIDLGEHAGGSIVLSRLANNRFVVVFLAAGFRFLKGKKLTWPV